MGNPKIPTIRPLEGYVHATDDDVLKQSTNVVEGIGTNTSVFTNPPILPADLKAQSDVLSGLIAESADGSKKVIAQRNKVRHGITKDLGILGRYVEKIANGDMATFKLSGFNPRSEVRTPQVFLSPNFRCIDHGKVTGQLLVRMKSVPGALSYELRYAPQSNGTSGAWITQLVTAVKSSIPLNGLTPGTLYAFQARFMDKSGYSDWSDAVTMMCT